MRAEALAVVVAALLVATSCGDGGSSTPTPVSTPTPAPVETIVKQGSYSIPAPDDDGFSFYESDLITTSATGRLVTTVNWTYASNSVWMYIAEGDCTGDQFDNLDCPGGPTCECLFSASSEQDSPKPRSLTVTNASAGTRTLIVWNRGPLEESISYQAVLTANAVGVNAAGSASAAAAMKEDRRPRRRFHAR